MGARLILILGGARSGKSVHAERLATELAGEGGGVLYVATAQALDEEMARRIARHRERRPAGWRTLEEPLQLGPAITAALAGSAPANLSAAPERVEGVEAVLVECVTLWLSNLLFGPDHAPDESLDEDEAVGVARVAVDSLLAAHGRYGTSTILVSNEVGMGLVPPYPMGRLYRDVLGRVNAWLAAAADEVYLMVAGIPLRIKPKGS